MRFYDTCSLLKKVDSLFDEENFVISSVTLKELESIKTSINKDAEIKYLARKLLHLLDEHPDRYIVHIFTLDMLDNLSKYTFPIADDIKILSTALDYQHDHPEEQLIFVTNDLSLKNIAGLFFSKDCIESVNEDFADQYCGYKEIQMSDDQMTVFYSCPNENIFGLKINEYINVYNNDGELVDTKVWTGSGYRHLTYKSFNSRWFGEVKPLKGDI